MTLAKLLSVIAIALAFLVNAAVQAQPTESPVYSDAMLQSRLEDLQRTNAQVPGFAIAVIKDGARFSAATGVAAPDETPMTTQTPFRLASVTKTFVAAAILRLREQGKLGLDTPISELLSRKHLHILQSDGYDIDVITVRQLLMHASGLNDHFRTEKMRNMVFADPQRIWTPTDQIRVMVEATEPIGAPGEHFAYSDTGYVLLGEIIERLTGEPLGQAVRELNRFEALQLGDLRWEGEPPDSNAPERAHQWISGFDTYAMHGSVDAFGGGGVIGDVIETARYYHALFNGDVFNSPETLELMKTAPSHPPQSPYRMGLFAGTVGEDPAFMHGGFWGVFALHVPAHDVTIVGVALDQSGEDAIRNLALDLARQDR